MKTVMKELFGPKDIIVHFDNEEMAIIDGIVLTHLISIACNYNASYEFLQEANLLVVTSNTIKEKEQLYKAFSRFLEKGYCDEVINPWLSYILLN